MTGIAERIGRNEEGLPPVTDHWLWHAVGWLAFALNVWGNMMLTTKSRAGWVVRLACNVCWLPYAVLTGAWALLANHVLFMGINVLGWMRWRRDT